MTGQGCRALLVYQPDHKLQSDGRTRAGLSLAGTCETILVLHPVPTYCPVPVTLKIAPLESSLARSALLGYGEACGSAPDLRFIQHEASHKALVFAGGFALFDRARTTLYPVRNSRFQEPRIVAKASPRYSSGNASSAN